MKEIVCFITPLELIVLTDSSFRLGADFYVSLEGNEIVIPEGFETDLASVPRLPIVYLAVGNTGHKAAVLHDWLYSTNMFPREICDGYFYHGLRAMGIGYFAAKAMFYGVRAGGAKYYEAAGMKIKEQQEQADLTAISMYVEGIDYVKS